MADLQSQLITVLSVLAGVWVARAGRRHDVRLRAGEQLAELPRLVWGRLDEDSASAWVDLQIHLGRLHVLLRAAGVPRGISKGLQAAAVLHWDAVDLGPDDGEPFVTDAARELLDEWQQAVLAWLDPPWHIVRRIRAWSWAKRTGPAPRTAAEPTVENFLRQRLRA